MPLVRIDMIEGRSHEEIKALTDAVQEVMIEVFAEGSLRSTRQRPGVPRRHQSVGPHRVVVANPAADWSLGLGRAQFLEGDL